MEHALEATTAQQSGVDHLRTVGCGDDDDAVEGFNAVHAGQQLVDHAVADIAAFRCAATASHRSDGLKLIKEDDGRR